MSHLFLREPSLPSYAGVRRVSLLAGRLPMEKPSHSNKLPSSYHFAQSCLSPIKRITINSFNTPIERRTALCLARLFSRKESQAKCFSKRTYARIAEGDTMRDFIIFSVRSTKCHVENFSAGHQSPSCIYSGTYVVSFNTKKSLRCWSTYGVSTNTVLTMPCHASFLARLPSSEALHNSMRTS